MPKIISSINRAANSLKNGELVAFATETVYGLGAVANNLEAVEKVYAYKGRPREHPLILHLHDVGELQHWCRDIPLMAKKLATAFMPGPLTLLLPKKDTKVQFVGNSDYIAVRIPAHVAARQLLQAVGTGVVAPSANRFGCVSPTSAAHVNTEFSDKDDLLILDGGDCSVGIESTIVGFTEDDYFIARPGDITANDIEQLLHKKSINTPFTTRAPGLFSKHYAPNTPLQLCTSNDINSIIALYSTPIAVLSSVRPPTSLLPPTSHWYKAPDNAKEYAQSLYKNLRQMDKHGSAIILIETPPMTDEWQAVYNRLQRAAAK